MTTSPFGNFLDKFKSSTKQAADSMKLAGKIAGLKVERSTQKAEKERLLKEIGGKTYAIYNKTKSLDANALLEETTSELHHLERIDKRIEELDQEITRLQSELVHQENKDVIDATEISEADESQAKGKKE